MIPRLVDSAGHVFALQEAAVFDPFAGARGGLARMWDERLAALGLYQWQRSGEGLTTETGIAQWADLTGHGKHLVQADPAKQPALGTDRRGRACPRLDGSDDSLRVAYGVGKSQAALVAAVVRFDELSDAYRYLWDGINTTYRCAFRPVLNSHLWGMYAKSASVNGSEYRATDGVWYVAVVCYDGANSFIRVNGHEVLAAGSGDPGASVLTGLSLGCAYNESLFHKGEIAEVLAKFDVTDPAADAATIEKYLMWRHGIGTARQLKELAREAAMFLSPHPADNAYLADSVRSDRSGTQALVQTGGTNEWFGVACTPVQDPGTPGELIPQTMTMDGLVPGQNYSVWACFAGGPANALCMVGKFTRAGDWDGRIVHDPENYTPAERVCAFPNNRLFGGGKGVASMIFVGNQVAGLDGKIQFDLSSALGDRLYFYGGAVGAPWQPRIPAGCDVVWEDGTWNWFSHPVGTILANGNYLVGILGSDGRAGVVNYNPATKESTKVDLSSWVARDDHNNPALIHSDADAILAGYTRHGETATTEWRLTTGANALNPTLEADWAAEQADGTLPVNQPAYDEASYIQLVKAPDGRLYRFYRVRTNHWEFKSSDDHGASWSASRPFVTKNVPDNWSVYSHYACDSQGRVHCHALAGNAMSQRGTGDTVHFYWDPDTDNIHNSDGTVVRALGALPVKSDVELNASSVVMPYAGDERFLWVSDLKIGAGDVPVCVGMGATWPDVVAERDFDNRIWYYYASWNPATGQWDADWIAAAGSGIAPDRRGYSGEIVLNPLNTAEVAFGSNAAAVAEPDGDGAWTSPVHQLYLGTLAGGSWTFEKVTNNGTEREANVRPQYLVNDAGNKVVLVWMNGLYSSGGYNSLEYRILAMDRSAYAAAPELVLFAEVGQGGFASWLNTPSLLQVGSTLYGGLIRGNTDVSVAAFSVKQQVVDAAEIYESDEDDDHNDGAAIVDPRTNDLIYVQSDHATNDDWRIYKASGLDVDDLVLHSTITGASASYVNWVALRPDDLDRLEFWGRDGNSVESEWNYQWCLDHTAGSPIWSRNQVFEQHYVHAIPSLDGSGNWIVARGHPSGSAYPAPATRFSTQAATLWFHRFSDDALLRPDTGGGTVELADIKSAGVRHGLSKNLLTDTIAFTSGWGNALLGTPSGTSILNHWGQDNGVRRLAPSGSGLHKRYQAVDVEAGKQYTASLYVRSGANGGRVVALALSGATGGSPSVRFNLDTEEAVLISAGLDAYGLVPCYENGWYRMWFTWTAAATESVDYMFFPCLDDGTSSYDAAVYPNDGFVECPQFEEGALSNYAEQTTVATTPTNAPCRIFGADPKTEDAYTTRFLDGWQFTADEIEIVWNKRWGAFGPSYAEGNQEAYYYHTVIDAATGEVLRETLIGPMGDGIANQSRYDPGATLADRPGEVIYVEQNLAGSAKSYLKWAKIVDGAVVAAKTLAEGNATDQKFFRPYTVVKQTFYGGALRWERGVFLKIMQGGYTTYLNFDMETKVFRIVRR